MNPQNEDRDVTCNSAYNPFPEPQTIPAGWDTSGFYSTPQTDSIEQADTLLKANPINRQAR